jgi:predicted ATPase
MRRSAGERLALGVNWYQVRYLCMLAESFLEVGSTEEGLAVLGEAKALAVRKDEHMWEAELERIEGELRRALSDSPPEVEAHFQVALAVARRQSAKSFELRAAMSLARLWRDQGGGAEARGLLAPTYGWFTEDLKEAKMLLEALRE